MPARQRHDPITLGLHWLIALLIAAAYAASALVEDGPGGSWAMTLHGSLGLLVFGLSLLRILWRGLAPHPAPVPMAPMMARLAHFAHVALYVTMVAAPALGLAALWTRGQGISLFWLFSLPSPLASHRGLAEFLGGAHELAANGLVALAGLHAAAAIFHQYVLRDHTLERMVPGGDAK
ncbi:cytochrome b/b6 domain-containing protein [Sediminicoccus sp. KRV36]|uniref:cytochrome b n=1 Tax=Sediminicoccus sp. KRV36 TaxID=3133721 RepID=UPI00200DF423|nr:cytochrome b/b6 domain-containing protein [Sediminicoccus rosea]UPY36871.1 cytochrome b/b6 domain-containing protein [Sediminicoccus rosea]